MTDAEEFYIAARILEYVEQNEGKTDASAVCARAAEKARDGSLDELPSFLDSLESEAEGSDAEKAVRRLRLALEEVRSRGTARITEEVGDGVLARLRSEY